jgi:flavin-binding protein dodecin
MIEGQNAQMYKPLNLNIMAIVKVIEVIAGSEKSFDDAVKQALTQASKSVKNIKSIYVKHFNANVEDNRIVSYGVNAKISFEVEDMQ